MFEIVAVILAAALITPVAFLTVYALVTGNVGGNDDRNFPFAL